MELGLFYFILNLQPTDPWCNMLQTYLNGKNMRRQCQMNTLEAMVDSGVACKLSAWTFLTYDGFMFYLSHHEVFKPESTTTPCRIVFNSSTNFKGYVLNNYWVKGSDLLNNILGILISFLENQVTLTWDIRKTYVMQERS